MKRWLSNLSSALLALVLAVFVWVVMGIIRDTLSFLKLIK